MTLAARLSGQTNPVASVTGISAARGGVLQATINGVTSAEGVFFSIGVSADTPATYNDMSGEVGGLLPIPQASSNAKYNAGTGLYDVTIQKSLTGVGLGAGNKLWLAVFLDAEGDPDPAAVPDVVAGPLTVVA